MSDYTILLIMQAFDAAVGHRCAARICGQRGATLSSRAHDGSNCRVYYAANATVTPCSRICRLTGCCSNLRFHAAGYQREDHSRFSGGRAIAYRPWPGAWINTDAALTTPMMKRSELTSGHDTRSSPSERRPMHVTARLTFPA